MGSQELLHGVFDSGEQCLRDYSRNRRKDKGACKTNKGKFPSQDADLHGEPAYRPEGPSWQATMFTHWRRPAGDLLQWAD